MKYLLIVAFAAAAWFGWKKFQEDKVAEPPQASDPDRTAGANLQNRMDTMSGMAPDPTAR